MPREVSPAAAAAVSRLLSGAGIKRAREYRKGIEFEGYYTEAHGDHVRVDYTPNYWVEPEDALVVIEHGLRQCLAALTDYEVSWVVIDKYIYGGNAPMMAPVLEVRKPEWTRSDRDA